MEKIKLGPQTLLYPMPAILVGSNVKPDPRKINPLVYSPGTRGYYRIGEFVAEAFKVGKEYDAD